MKCPTCVKEGKRSFVYDRGTYTTCMGVQEYYDEDGNHHYHDPNTSEHGFECSNGHRWSKSSKPKCPTCDRSPTTKAT